MPASGLPIFPADTPMTSQGAGGWKRELGEAIRDPEELIERLGLPEELKAAARRSAEAFPLVVPESYVARMEPGNSRDPLLLQVLPTLWETESPEAFLEDAVGDLASRKAPGLLQKYEGRGLLVTTGTCAVHCRYCFRRHYPYGEEPKSLAQWEPAFEAIRNDESLQEILLSGGDPLVLSDRRVGEFLYRLAEIPQIKRVRIHSRLPVVLPSRVTEELAELLSSTRLTPFVVIHANHRQELVGDCGAAVRRLVRGGITVLNQAVLLRGINDDLESLVGLSEGLLDLGVVPYYLHQLDRVAGTAHFEVDRAKGLRLIDEMRERLPGYGIPQYVEEIAGGSSKMPIRPADTSR